MPPDPSATFPRLDIGGTLLLGPITIVFTFLFVELFDTTGTLVGLAHRAGAPVRRLPDDPGAL